MDKLFEYKYLKIISHYCYQLNFSFVCILLPLAQLTYIRHFLINGILEPIIGDIITYCDVIQITICDKCKKSQSQQNKTECMKYYQPIIASSTKVLTTWLLKLVYNTGLGSWRLMPYSTINNISTYSWRSVLFVGETGVPRENHRSAASH